MDPILQGNCYKRNHGAIGNWNTNSQAADESISYNHKFPEFNSHTMVP